jgi:uncharacterized membrane protein YeaQ/YmgE (transglycosylase-associated protein family)
MLSLSLLWLLIGLFIGSLAWMAHCYPPSWQRFRWLRMLALGVVIALAAGWLGVLLTGQFFATMLSLWGTVVGVVVLPHGSHWLHTHLRLKAL